MCLAKLRPKMQHAFCGAPPFIRSIEFKPMIQEAASIYLHLVELVHKSAAWISTQYYSICICKCIYKYCTSIFSENREFQAVEAEISYIYIAECSHGHKTIQNPTILSILDLHQDFKTTVLQLVMTQVQHREFIGTVTWSNTLISLILVWEKKRVAFFEKNAATKMVWSSSIVLQNPLLRGGRKRPCLISFSLLPPKEWVVWLAITHGLRGLVGGIVQPKKW